MIIIWDQKERTSEVIDFIKTSFPRRTWWGFRTIESLAQLPYRNVIHEVHRHEDGVFFLFEEPYAVYMQSLADLGYFVIVYTPNVSYWSQKLEAFNMSSIQHVISFEGVNPKNSRQ